VCLPADRKWGTCTWGAVVLMRQTGREEQVCWCARQGGRCRCADAPDQVWEHHCARPGVTISLHWTRYENINKSDQVWKYWYVIPGMRTSYCAKGGKTHKACMCWCTGEALGGTQGVHVLMRRRSTREHTRRACANAQEKHQGAHKACLCWCTGEALGGTQGVHVLTHRRSTWGHTRRACADAQEKH